MEVLFCYHAGREPVVVVGVSSIRAGESIPEVVKRLVLYLRDMLREIVFLTCRKPNAVAQSLIALTFV